MIYSFEKNVYVELKKIFKRFLGFYITYSNKQWGVEMYNSGSTKKLTIKIFVSLKKFHNTDNSKFFNLLEYYFFFILYSLSTMKYIPILTENVYDNFFNELMVEWRLNSRHIWGDIKNKLLETRTAVIGTSCFSIFSHISNLNER